MIASGDDASKLQAGYTAFPAGTWKCDVILQVSMLDPLLNQPIWSSEFLTVTLVDRGKVPVHLRSEVDAAIAATASATSSSATAAVHQASSSQAGVLSAWQSLQAQGATAATTMVSMGCFRGQDIRSLFAANTLTAPAPVVIGIMRFHTPRCAAFVQPHISELPPHWLHRVVQGATLEHAWLSPSSGSSAACSTLSASLTARRENDTAAFDPASLLHNATAHSMFNSYARALQDGNSLTSGSDPSAGLLIKHGSPGGVASGNSGVVTVLERVSLTADGDDIASDVRGLPDASVGVVTLHWRLYTLASPEELLLQCWRVLAPGGVLRVVEPDFTQDQSPSRRVLRVHGRKGVLTTPAAVGERLTKLGFHPVLPVALDTSNYLQDTSKPLAATSVMDTVDAEDWRLWQ